MEHIQIELGKKCENPLCGIDCVRAVVGDISGDAEKV